MTNRKPAQFRQLHRAIAPIMALPLLLTAITGSIYQITDLTGNEARWILELHKGNIGSLKLEAIYPFLNALVVSGVNLAMIAKGRLGDWETGRLGDWGTGGEEEEMVRLFPPPSTRATRVAGYWNFNVVTAAESQTADGGRLITISDKLKN